MDELQLPDGFRVLKTQVAGHTFQAGSDALGLLQDAKSACVLKPLGKPACGKRELAFYKSLQQDDDEVLVQVRALVPRFYYELELIVNQQVHFFLKLEDITHSMMKPCIMDIKVGKRTWDPLATPEKRAAEEQKYVRSKQVFGLCLPGFQMYPLDGGAVVRHGKDYGKQLDAKDFKRTIALFLNLEPTICVPLVREVLRQLYAIDRWFTGQRLFHFYASSLLIAYDLEPMKMHLKGLPQNGKLLNGYAQKESFEDGASEQDYQCESTAEPSPPNPAQWVKVRMIDFAHVFPAENGQLDANYVFGLRNLIAVIEDLLVR